MGKFSLEHKIKERLKGHEVHIDKRELWKGLGIEEEEKDRKAIWFWWVGGLVGILFVSGLWWYLQKDGLDTSNVQDTSTIEIDESLSKTGNESLDQTSASEKLAAMIQEADEEIDADVINNIDVDNVSKSNTKTNTQSNQVNSQTGIGTQERDENINYSGNEKEQLISSTNQKAMDNNVNIDRTINNKNEELSNKSGAKKELHDALLIDELPQIFSVLEYERALITFKDIAISSPPQPVAKARRFEIEAFGGIGTINRTLSSVNEDRSGYIFMRDTSETVIEQVSIGLSLKYRIARGLYSKVGLSINRWNEKYSYSEGSDTIIVPNEVPLVITEDLQGNITTTYGEGFQTTYNTVNWLRYNRLTQIDVPVTLGYEFRISKWSVFGEASAIVNLKQRFTGYLNTPQGIATKDPKEMFKPSIGLNFGFNAGVGYGITPRLRARLSARYYRSGGSVLLSSVGVDQRYTSIGLRLGIGYLF